MLLNSKLKGNKKVTKMKSNFIAIGIFETGNGVKLIKMFTTGRVNKPPPH